MFDWMLDPVWPELRATITAAGGLLALLVAASTYALNSRSKREEQARLVYSHVVSARRVPKGSDPEFPEGDDVYASTHLAGWRSNGPLARDAMLVVAEVHNQSKEVLGPLRVGLEYSDAAWPDSPGLVLEAVNPESSVRIALLGKNDLAMGVPIVRSSIVFRDSAGRWWTRRGTDRITLKKQAPRLVGGAAQSVDRDSFQPLMLGNGLADTYISSKVLLGAFGVAGHVPGVRTLVEATKLRERAERRALAARMREINDAPELRETPG